MRIGIIPDDDTAHVSWGKVELGVDKENPRTELSILSAESDSPSP